MKGPWVALLPEVSLLRVRVDASGANDLVYSLVHNDAHTNVALMFDEAERRLPADDTVTVVRGHYGSYPNFFFEVPAEQIGAFTGALRGLTSDADLEAFAGTYGIRRTDPRFWATSDWLRDDLRREQPDRRGGLRPGAVRESLEGQAASTDSLGADSGSRYSWYRCQLAFQNCRSSQPPARNTPR